jgi:hypothetical protein
MSDKILEKCPDCLEKCPFCPEDKGHAPYLEIEGEDCFYICDDCGARGPVGTSVAEALKWQNRPIEDELREDNERMKSLLSRIDKWFLAGLEENEPFKIDVPDEPEWYREFCVEVAL